MRTLFTRHQAWALLSVAIIACGVTLAIASLFDPFGRQEARVDGAVRRVAAVNLCITYRSFTTRLAGLSAAQRAADPGLVHVLEGGLSEMRVAQRLLGVLCTASTILPRETSPALTTND